LKEELAQANQQRQELEKSNKRLIKEKEELSRALEEAAEAKAMEDSR
jgi:hypothetical protein